MRTRLLVCLVLCNLLVIAATTGQCASFDERLWEKYAEINLPGTAGIATIHLDPRTLGDIKTRIPFSDVRVVTDRKEEVPWQIAVKKPETQISELPVRMQNVSRTQKGDSWIELSVESERPRMNAVDISTADTDFSRQVQILGSADGKNWNVVRQDGVIFDVNKGEKLRHTRLTFSEITFRHLAIKIINGDAQPMNITGVKVLSETTSPGQTYRIHGAIDKSPKNNSANNESILDIKMDSIFPVDRLNISTSDRNFQRSVEVQIKRDYGRWEHWTSGTIYNFETVTMRESKMTLDIPEITVREYRLIFKNLDSPPLQITQVYGEGYGRILLFKQPVDRKLYLFWGNPTAEQPQYDLAGIVIRQRFEQLPIAQLGEAKPNTKFAGAKAGLPFTERYKYLLYIVAILVIAVLVFLQYRVFKRLKHNTPA
ncbi:MAG TPA: DUF3999 family protein [Syntrophorhabdaceae bacterium]|nr:DUF3999 family protein [Syntrophorhabdaceae bacterium]